MANENGTQPKLKVFVSYSRKDMVFADRLEAFLKPLGIEPLIDRTEILILAGHFGSKRWQRRLHRLPGS